MRAAVFLDTNILLYAISSAREEASKKRVARGLLARSDWGLSVQVLQEFYSAATRKLGVEPLQARQHLRDFRVFDSEAAATTLSP